MRSMIEVKAPKIFLFLSSNPAIYEFSFQQLFKIKISFSEKVMF